MDFLHFADGLQTTTNSFLRKPSELTKSINVHGDTVGSLTKRLGYSEFGTTVATTSILGAISYNDISGGTRYLLRYVSGDIQYSTGGAWTSIHGGLNSTAKVEFTILLDQAFGVGYSSAGYLTPFNIDGTTYSTATNLTGAPSGKFITVYKDEVYILNLDGAPDKFQWSSIPDTGGTTITWTSTDYQRVYTSNGEEITGGHVNKSINELLVFKLNSLHTWDGYRMKDAGGVGTTSHRSIKTIGGVTYFFNKGGIYAYNGGGEPVLISRKIEKWIKGIDQTALGDVFAEVEDEKYYKLYVGSIAVDGDTYTNCEIRYSTVDNTFTIYRYYDTLTCYCQHTVSSVVRTYAGTSDGEMMKLAEGSDQVYADDGHEISAEFEFETDLGIPKDRKFIDSVFIYSANPQNLKGHLRAKGKDWSSWFDVYNERDESVNPDDGRIMQFGFSESSKNNPFVFEGLTFNAYKTE